MREYSEQQRAIRHRNGHYAFALVTGLIIFNIFLDSARQTGWAESKDLEYFIILIVATGFFNISNALQGAYADQVDHPVCFVCRLCLPFPPCTGPAWFR